MADEPGLLEQFAPYIEKLILTPHGIGLIAIGIGVLLRLQHAPDLVFQGPVDPNNPSTALPPPIKRYGLDQVIFKVPLKAVETYIQTLAQGIAAGPIMGILGIFGYHLNQRAIDQATGNIDVLLSDLLIIMGVGVFLGSSVSQLTSAISSLKP